MGQTRFLDYATTVTSSAINNIGKASSTAGILSPQQNIIEINTNNSIKINAHTVITPDGVIITNTDIKTLNIVLTTDQKSYTIVLRHTYTNSSGGNAATIELIDNLFPVTYFPDCVVLGWLMYPGSSVSLDSTMILLPRSLKIAERSNDDMPFYSACAPFDSKWIELTTDPAIQISHGFESGNCFTKIYNSSSIIIQNVIRVIPIIASANKPAALRITCKAEFQAGLIVSIFDEYGTEYTPTNNIIANTDWNTFYMKLPNLNGINVFKPHSTFNVKLTFQLSHNKTLWIKSLDMVDFNLPVAPTNEIVPLLYPYSFTRLPSVLSQWNPIQSLPLAPSLGDRYLSTASGNTWVKDYIYEWSGSAWLATIPQKGNVLSIVGVDYIYNGYLWTMNVAKHSVNV